MRQRRQALGYSITPSALVRPLRCATTTTTRSTVRSGALTNPYIDGHLWRLTVSAPWVASIHRVAPHVVDIVSCCAIWRHLCGTRLLGNAYCPELFEHFECFKVVGGRQVRFHCHTDEFIPPGRWRRPECDWKMMCATSHDSGGTRLSDLPHIR